MDIKENREWLEEILENSKCAILVFVDGKLCQGLRSDIRNNNDLVFCGSKLGGERKKEIQEFKILIQQNHRDPLM